MRGSFSTTCCLMAFAFLLVMDNIGLEERIIYVDANALGANNGSSWENAYKFLQDALADANSSVKPVEIRVSQGVYKPDQGIGITPGNREATVCLFQQWNNLIRNTLLI